VGADVISFAPGTSSLGKGETIADTAITLGGIGVRVIVVRHPESGFPRRLAESFEGHVINAGDGPRAHPTQALLDLMTLRNEFGRFEGLRVAIVGDILHSRVARSNIVGMTQLGIDVTLVGPPTLLPDAFAAQGVRIERDFAAVLPNVDAVMMLRIQRERITSSLLPALDDYTRNYQLDRRRLRALRADAVILHPGPYNRGVELTDDVLDDPRSRYVAQVANGVFVRMAVLDLLVNGARAA
jgi:aspartate carbamoyltransferase catalytic subunit